MPDSGLLKEMSITARKLIDGSKLGFGCLDEVADIEVLKGFNSSSYKKNMCNVDTVGTNYRGSKNYIAPMMKELYTYLNRSNGITKIKDVTAGGGSLIASVPKCIAKVEAYDKSNSICALKVMKYNRTLRALLRARECTITFIGCYLKDTYPEDYECSLLHEVHSQCTPERLEEALKEFYTTLKADSENNFADLCRMYRCFGCMSFDKDDLYVIMFELCCGLALLMTYGSFAGSWTSGNITRFTTLYKTLNELYLWYLPRMCMTDAEFLDYYLFEDCQVGKALLTKIFKTEYEIRTKDIKFVQADMFDVLEKHKADSHCLIVVDPPYPSEDGSKYQFDDFNFVDTNVKLMTLLKKSGSPYIVFCDENSIEVYEPAIHADNLNVYAINSRRKSDNVLEYIITNIELPTGPYSSLSKRFKDIFMQNYNNALDENMVFADEHEMSADKFDKTGELYTPLRKVESIVVDESYRQQWVKIAAEMEGKK